MEVKLKIKKKAEMLKSVDTSIFICSLHQLISLPKLTPLSSSQPHFPP
jgi:hypothetical protein